MYFFTRFTAYYYQYGGVTSMQKCTVLLSSINDVKNFVNLVSRYDYEIDLASGRYVVDAKSIMGIFSLDLSKPITVEIHSDNADDLLDQLKPYIQ